MRFLSISQEEKNDEDDKATLMLLVLYKYKVIGPCPGEIYNLSQPAHMGFQTI